MTEAGFSCAFFYILYIFFQDILILFPHHFAMKEIGYDVTIILYLVLCFGTNKNVFYLVTQCLGQFTLWAGVPLQGYPQPKSSARNLILPMVRPRLEQEAVELNTELLRPGH